MTAFAQRRTVVIIIIIWTNKQYSRTHRRQHVIIIINKFNNNDRHWDGRNREARLFALPHVYIICIHNDYQGAVLSDVRMDIYYAFRLFTYTQVLLLFNTAVWYTQLASDETYTKRELSTRVLFFLISNLSDNIYEFPKLHRIELLQLIYNFLYFSQYRSDKVGGT